MKNLAIKNLDHMDVPIGGMFFMYAKDQGKEVRTKQSHPWSYDPITHFIGKKDGNGTVYSDRMLQWDHKKHDEIALRIFGNDKSTWDNRTPKQVQLFLREYLGKPDLILTLVEEHCNQATGFPVWRFDYFDESKS